MVLLGAKGGGVCLLGEGGIADALAVVLGGGRCRHRDQLLDLQMDGNLVGGLED